MEELTLEEALIEAEKIPVPEITPSPKLEMTQQDRDEITIFLQAGISPREIFITKNKPIERAIQVENELKALETPVVIEEEII